MVYSMSAKKEKDVSFQSQQTGQRTKAASEDIWATDAGMVFKIEYLKKLVRTFLIEIVTLNLAHPQDVKRGLQFYDEVQRFEISLIERALIYSGGHQRRAATLLGLNATTLHSKMKQYGIKARPDEYEGLPDEIINDLAFQERPS